MQYALNIFVNRDWKDDEVELKNKLEIYNKFDLPLQLLLFPGGGDLTLKSKTRSDHYADKKGLPHYNYVLQPHLKGFLYVLNTLRSHGLDYIVDITVAYPDQLPKTELHFVRGHIPCKVCYYVKCYPLDNIPSSDDKLCHWIRQIWSEKEERLKYFYSHRQFPHEEQQLEKYGSIVGLYQAILFIVLSDVFVGVMLYYFFYCTLAYFTISLIWLSVKVITNGAVDTLLLNEIHKHSTTEPPKHFH